MMVISAVCVVALPEGEGRYIKELSVFFITATFSILAYLWLLVILVYITPNVRCSHTATVFTTHVTPSGSPFLHQGSSAWALPFRTLSESNS